MHSRYSAGHNWVNVSSYLLPLGPLLYVQGRYNFDPGPMQVGLLWLAGCLVSYALIAIHELGHFLAARLVGFEVTEVSIGHWQRLFTFRLGGVPVAVRAAPDSGYVVVKPSAALLQPAKALPYILGGLVAETGCLFLALPVLSFPSRVDSFPQLMGAFCSATLLWLGGWHLLLNLLPRLAQVGGAVYPTDGAQLLNLWRQRDKQAAIQARVARGARIDELIAAKRLPEAIEALEVLSREEPEMPHWMQIRAQLHIQNGDSRRGEALLRELLKRPLGPEKFAEVLDSLATLALDPDRKDLLPEAEAWINEALRYAPRAITLQGTRGSILVELGHLEEGAAVLQDVLRKSECPTDQAICSIYLAKVHHMRGETKQMRIWLEKAKAVTIDIPLVKRIQAEIETEKEPEAASAEPSHG